MDVPYNLARGLVSHAEAVLPEVSVNLNADAVFHAHTLQGGFGFFNRAGDLVDRNVRGGDQQADPVPKDEPVAFFGLLRALALQDHHANGQRLLGVGPVGEGLGQAVFEADRRARLGVHVFDYSVALVGFKRES